jgi:hypothetical protein
MLNVAHVPIHMSRIALLSGSNASIFDLVQLLDVDPLPNVILVKPVVCIE